MLNPTGHKAQRDVVHDEAVTVTTVPFNPMPEDCCAKLVVDCVAVPGEVEGYTRREKDEAKRYVVHDEVVNLVAVPSTSMPEDCCAEFGVGSLIVLGELEGHA